MVETLAPLCDVPQKVASSSLWGRGGCQTLSAAFILLFLYSVCFHLFWMEVCRFVGVFQLVFEVMRLFYSLLYGKNRKMIFLGSRHRFSVLLSAGLQSSLQWLKAAQMMKLQLTRHAGTISEGLEADQGPLRTEGLECLWRWFPWSDGGGVDGITERDGQD